jgi:hypothetical protein
MEDSNESAHHSSFDSLSDFSLWRIGHILKINSLNRLTPNDFSLPCFAIKDLLILQVHLLATIAKLLGPGAANTGVAESLLMKQQIPIMNRDRQHTPHLTALYCFLLGFWYHHHASE